MKNSAVALPKQVSWLLLILLVFWDAWITRQAGGESNPLWKPIVQAFGIDALWFLAILVLALFYLVVKLAGWYYERFENSLQGEEITLTSLVIAFGFYDFYLTFLLPRFGYFGTKSHYALIPFLAIPVLAYSIWATRKQR